MQAQSAPPPLRNPPARARAPRKVPHSPPPPAPSQHLAAKQGYGHAKGLLYDLWLRTRPRDLENASVVIMDDNKAVAATFREYSTPLVLINAGLYDPPRTFLHVSGEDMPAEEYRAALNAHFERIEGHRVRRDRCAVS